MYRFAHLQVFDLFQKSVGLLQKEKQKALIRGKGRKDGLASAEVDTALKRVSVSRYIAVQVGRPRPFTFTLSGHGCLRRLF